MGFFLGFFVRIMVLWGFPKLEVGLNHPKLDKLKPIPPF